MTTHVAVPATVLVLRTRAGTTGLGTLVASWRTDVGGLVLTSIGAAVIAAYLGVLVSNRRTRSPTFAPSGIAFVIGVLVCVWAFCSGLGSLDDTAPGIVVADHLALISVAPVLLAFGAPIRRVQAAMLRGDKETRRGPTSAFLKAAFHPAVAFAVLVTLEYVFLLSPLYGWTLDHQSGGDLIRGAFLLAGCLYWWPIVGSDPWPTTMGGGARMLDLAATLPFTAFLGIDLTLTDRLLPRSGTLDATHVAGAEMWGYPTLFTLAALGAVFWWWMGQEDEQTAALDRGLDTIDAAEAIVKRAEVRLDDNEEDE